MIWRNGVKVAESEEERHARHTNHHINPCENCADNCWNLDGADEDGHWRQCPVDRDTDQMCGLGGD